MSPRTQSQHPCILVYLLSTKMEVVGRSERQEGALSLPLDHWGLWGAREWKTLSHSMVPERVPHTHSTQASAHESSHTDTHMLGGNKYSLYQRSPSPDTSGGVPPKGEELSAQFFKGGKGLWGRERSDSASICWLEIHLGTFPRREGCEGNQLFFLLSSRLPFHRQRPSLVLFPLGRTP